MNSTHGNGLGLDPIHTEANQKHLFPEINLSLGNELYIHPLGVGGLHTHTHTLTHIMHHRQNTGGKSPDRQPEPLGRKSDVSVSFKGHLDKSGLVAKLSDAWCSVSGTKQSPVRYKAAPSYRTNHKNHGHMACAIHPEPCCMLAPANLTMTQRRTDSITVVISILQVSRKWLRKNAGTCLQPLRPAAQGAELKCKLSSVTGSRSCSQTLRHSDPFPPPLQERSETSSSPVPTALG